MPNINSAIKRVKTSEKANSANSAKKSAMRRSIRRFEEAIASGDDNAKELYQVAQKAIDSAASKGLIHSNKAARDKSRLAAKLSK
ncbi:30S ribosomal protein S20 [Atopobacter sp. AH10]|uniref:30S ribosomal protein S20 n=1 Tax=Atopobacter sp. AH10 TaxID=2315861 RepID=UPI000EF26D98|nr:30S ribosomal protein S20 [Atopobacter sp. AH10]RLK64017.1 30S ribosomal protein S20 [Atopobacter sp. AH10]